MSLPPHTTARLYAGERLGYRCFTCAHFRPGPEGDRVTQCTQPEAPLYRASEDMDKATACRMYREGT